MITLSPPVLNLLRSVLLIKSGIFLLILISSILPDHDAGVFNPPSTPTSNAVDYVIRHLFQGFRKWDSIYFTFIAQWGYVYEQSLAFFPLLPLVLGSLGRTLQPLTAYIFSLETLIVITGVLLNFVVNVVNTLLLYRLTRQMLQSPRLSFLTALLYCFNPASVFFGSLYSESLFFMFTCFGLILLDSGHPVCCTVLFALSTLCRSNGLINVGFLCFYSVHSLELRSLLWNSKALEESRKSMLFFVNNALKWWFDLLYFVLPRLILAVVCVTPYLMYEAFGYLLFCLDPDPKFRIKPQLIATPSDEVLNYGIQSGFKMPASIGTQLNHSNLFEPPLWCNQKLPVFYSAIQSQYWNVGLWRYYDWKQVPNFMLAAPIVFLVFSCSSQFYQRAPRAYKTLGFMAETALDRRLVPHVFHALFLCIYGVTHINVQKIRLLDHEVGQTNPIIGGMHKHREGLTLLGIQVITRMIFSSCPIIYWYCAYLLNSNLSLDSEYALNKLSKLCITNSSTTATTTTKTTKHHQPQNPKTSSSWSSQLRNHLNLVWLVINPGQYARLRDRLLLVYFFGYTIVGCLMHPNFLPWT